MSPNRRFWHFLHRDLGLATFLVLLLLGATGSLITYQHEIDAWLNPELLTTKGEGAHQSIGVLAAKAQMAIPKGANLEWARIPGNPGEVLSWFYTDANGLKWELTIDPYTASVLGQRLHDYHFIRLIYRFHADLYAGITGNIILGIIAVLFIIQIISGLVVWWPRISKWKQALTIKATAGAARFNFDLHRVFGAYCSLLLLVSAFTGIYMALPPVMNWAVSFFSPVTERPVLQYSSGPQRLSIDHAIETGKSAFPGAHPRILVLPTAKVPSYEISMFYPNDRLWRKSGEWVAHIDAHNGAILHLNKPYAGSTGDRFIEWMFPLHNGEAFGETSRAIICIAGLIPALLTVTGLQIWLRKRKTKLRKPVFRE